jgi:aspartate racemase
MIPSASATVSTSPRTRPPVAGAPRPATQVVGILGGMGPAAGADFAAEFVRACTERLQELGEPVTDQAYPEHWIAQLPIPDRTRALEQAGPEHDAPFEPMAWGIAQLERLGVRVVAMACNTAHAWHQALQRRFADVELLHAPREVAAELAARGHREAALLATRGTYRTGLYDAALSEAGIVCHRPTAEERQRLMDGIYDGVKKGDYARARACFEDVAQRMVERHGPIPLIMGCTEIPLVLADSPRAEGWTLVNSTGVLAKALARRAYAPAATMAEPGRRWPQAAVAGAL